MKTLNVNELDVRRAIEKMPVGSIAALAAAGAQDALHSLDTTMTLLECVQRAEPGSAVWAVPALSDVRRSRAAIAGGLDKLIGTAPLDDPFTFPPIGGGS